MGVPRLFPWLIKTFPAAHLRFQEGRFVVQVDGLYIDANGLLHSAAQLVFNYGDRKRRIDPYFNLSFEDKIKKVYETFFEMIKTVVVMAGPTKTIYIAIDGPAPLAKQAQQRQRRFVAALQADQTKSEWDSTCITPGTIFMFELTKFMNYKIREEVNRGKWSGLEVFFSPPTVPGEGEHKIMDYIRSLEKEDAHRRKHCMFGPDGDLIMLTLATHLPNMFLLREDQYNLGNYDLLDMGKIRRGLSSSLKQNLAPRDAEARTEDDISNDFILLGFFVGNDFVPKLQMFTHLEDGLALILSLYAKLAGEGRSFVTRSGELRFTKGEFKNIVMDMARLETKYLADQIKNRPIDERFIDHTLLKNMSHPPPMGNGTLNFEGFRRDYYLKSGIMDPGTVDRPGPEVRRLCGEYLKSLYWVFKYYVVGIPSWSHCYSRYYAPLMNDLSHVLETLTEEEESEIITFNFGSPSLPFVQLLSVIAPKNADLLPKPFHDLMRSPESPLVKAGIYPLKFYIDYEGKTKEHMGVALLPFIDQNIVRKHYQPIADDLVNEYVRNSMGTLKRFIYDPLYTATYISDYGTIQRMHVRKEDLNDLAPAGW